MTQSTNQKSGRAELLAENTQKVMAAYDKLGTDSKLALLYYVYEKMGDSVTPAAPTATEPELAPILMEDFYNLAHDDQMNVMRDIVNGADTEYSRAYGSLTENNQLMVWYAWAQSMGDTVVGMPDGYNPPEPVTQALGGMEALEFEEQISLLREIASGMGYSQVKPIATQAETGKTSSL
jgi:Orange carotenoid protein, N-terminal